MNDKMQEGFEAWHRSVVAGEPPHDKYSNGDYINQHVQRYWAGWKASRAAIAVEWPDQHTYTVPDVAGAAILDCRTAFSRAACQAPDSTSAFCALLAERNSLAFLLKRFVDGEHDQEENQGERHLYHDEAEALLAYLGGEAQGHTLVPDHLLRAEHEKKKALLADAELFRWLADQCREEFQLEVTGIGADGKEVRWALGYEGEADLRQAVQAAMLEDRAVATPFTDNENVSRHEER